MTISVWFQRQACTTSVADQQTALGNPIAPMDILHRLETTRRETLEYFALGDDSLVRSYAPGKWSVRYLLHHLADSETVLFDRIRRVLSEGRSVIWAYDQDAWARGLDYSKRPMELSRHIYESVRQGVLYYCELHYEKDGLLEFVHSETGVRTLRDEFDKVAAHNEHHLNQIRIALHPS
ncbi:MAG: DinB family protein [Gemmatimonadaceae bacterium]